MLLKSFMSFVLLFALNPVFANAKPLRVGMELQYPPFEMSTKDGTPSGISVDLAKALGKYLGRKVIIENIAWDGLIPSLKTKKIDIIISSMTITNERKKVIDFSIPYAQANLSILTNPTSGVKSVKDLNQKGRVIAVKKGTTGNIYAMEHLKKAKLLILDKESSAVLEVIQKRADAFIYDQLTVYRDWEHHKKTTVALLKPITKKPGYWGIALRQNEPKLKKKINAFIKKAKSDGTFDKLAYKYLKNIKKTFIRLNIPFFF
ncbi:MAG: transporter substrate-binding domain-containing protein [Epsilonproteobacteria bacterium]|nr:transporter substrate-binding domain-containing protein [Campylobacterota bacterium]